PAGPDTHPRRGRTPARPIAVSASPARPQPISTQSGPADRAPSKNATERSRLPPAPGGSSWPIAPHGLGSSSGAVVSPEIGLPKKNTSSAPRPTPAGPTSAPSPQIGALTARLNRLIAPASAR